MSGLLLLDDLALFVSDPCAFPLSDEQLCAAVSTIVDEDKPSTICSLFCLAFKALQSQDDPHRLAEPSLFCKLFLLLHVHFPETCCALTDLIPLCGSATDCVRVLMTIDQLSVSSQLHCSLLTRRLLAVLAKALSAEHALLRNTTTAITCPAMNALQSVLAHCEAVGAAQPAWMRVLQPVLSLDSEGEGATMMNLSDEQDSTDDTHCDDTQIECSLLKEERLSAMHNALQCDETLSAMRRLLALSREGVLYMQHIKPAIIPYCRRLSLSFTGRRPFRRMRYRAPRYFTPPPMVTIEQCAPMKKTRWNNKSEARKRSDRIEKINQRQALRLVSKCKRKMKNSLFEESDREILFTAMKRMSFKPRKENKKKQMWRE